MPCSYWFSYCSASVGARGDIAKPVPIDGKCSVEADPLWTPQEIFVWLQVCVGKVADFNTAPGYGGDRDPKRPGGLPDNRILGENSSRRSS